MMAVTQQSNYSTPQQMPSAGPYNFMTNPSGMFVHSNPPKPLISSSTSLNSSQNTLIRNLVKNGDVDKLENLVLEGQGARLLGLTDSTPDMKVKSFLRGIPGYMAKVDLIHDAVIRGSVRELQTLLDKKKLSLARDAVGRGLAHKAVLHSQRNVLDWLGKKYPESIQLRDNESRTCLHYSGISKNPTDMYTFLLNLGANPEVVDIHGRKASYYLTNPQELYIEGVGGNSSTNSFKRNSKSRFQSQRRKQNPSPKSSPSPPISNTLPPNSNSNSAGALIKNSGISTPYLMPNGSPITRAQIRIWIHEKDISKLESIVWSGNGDKLLLETTNNPKVRRFLDNVPALLHHIKLIHTAAIHNDVEGLKEIRSRIEKDSVGSPGVNAAGQAPMDVSISRELFTARDSYGLSAMHKATGLNNRTAAEWLLYEFPATINLQDNFKRSPLHYAAVRVANEPNSSESIYKFLQRAGADTSLLDYRHRDPPYYLSHAQECDSFKFLRNIPDAPRVLTNPERVLLGWDRSGVVYRGLGAGAVAGAVAAGASGNKRKISATSGDEFGESVGGGGGGPTEEKAGSGTKVARTSDDDEERGFDEDEFLDEEEDEIRDVGDGYVADSDEGKYELNTEDVVIGEGDVVVEEEEPAEETQPEEPEKVEELEPPPPPEPEEEVPVAEEEQEAVTEEPEEEPPPPPPTEEPEPEEEAMEVEPAETQEEPPEPEPEPEDAAVPEPEKIEVDEEEPPPPEPTLSPSKEPEPEEQEPEQEEETMEDPPPPEPTPSPAPREKSAAPPSPQPPEENEPAISDQPPPEYTALQTPQLEEEEQETEEPTNPTPEPSPIIPPPAMPMQSAAMEMEDDDEAVETYIQNSDMESLVNLVLKGRGHELVDRQSPNPEIQEFLNNVPAYMAKIASIHNSANTGNMRDLQSLLDRKRLAEAQDTVGRGPLHHAVLGNNPQVVRYLVNGYPQCIDLTDFEGRSSLHYAAVLPDSGVMYKVLIQAGADPNLKDRAGNTPGIYLRRKDLLKLDDLLNPGTSKSSKRAVTRGTNKSSVSRTSNVDSWERPETPYPSQQNSAARPGSLSNHQQQQPPTPKNVSVIMISNSRPSSPTPSHGSSESDQLELPIQNLSLLNSFYLEVLSKENESIWSRTWKKLTTSNSTDVANKYVRRYLTPKIFHKVKMRSTPRYNSTLLDCIKFYPQFFIVAPDPHAYSSFAEVFMPAIMECNGRLDGNVPTQHPPMVLQGSATLLNDYPIVDLPSKFIQCVRVRASRNIRPFPFVPIIRKEELYEVEKIVKRVYAGEEYEWYDLESLEKHEREELQEEKGVWFPDATKISRFWPKGRGFLVNESGSEQIWCNAEDHIDVVLTSQYGRLHPLMEHVVEVMDKFTEVCEFHFNSQCGYLTVDPFRCGTGIKITFRLRLPNMMQNRSQLIQKCDDLKLTLKWKQKYKLFGSSNEISPDDWIEVENVGTWGCDENEVVLNVIKGAQELIKDEEDKGRAIDRATTKKKEHGEKDPKK